MMELNTRGDRCSTEGCSFVCKKCKAKKLIVLIPCSLGSFYSTTENTGLINMLIFLTF